MVNVVIDDSVRQFWTGAAFLAVVYVSGVGSTEGAGQRLESKVDSVISDLRRVGRAVLEEPMVQRMRATFRAMPEMDPSRYRPASESLIRRCMDQGLIHISPLVDTNNILSVQLRIPLGIYCINETAIAEWVYRIGYSNETYVTISGQVRNAEGKLVIADQEGVMGSPVADSGRAAIRGKPDKIMVIAYLPLDITTGEAELIVKEIEITFMSIFEGAKVRGRVLS